MKSRRLAAGGVLAACDAVMAGRVRRAFCAVRPPGHHAETDQASASACSITSRSPPNILSVVTNCRGWQSSISTCITATARSISSSPGGTCSTSACTNARVRWSFPAGAGDETGSGDGLGYTLNVPLDRGSGEAEYRAALEQKVLPALDKYGPQFILLSAGFDALMWDRVAHLSLEPRPSAGSRMGSSALRTGMPGGRLVSVLEGGYDLGNLGRAVVEHVRVDVVRVVCQRKAQATSPVKM